MKVTGLCPADAQALDAMIESLAAGSEPVPCAGRGGSGGTQASHESDELSERARTVSQVLSLISQSPAQESPADLVQRTLARVSDSNQRQQFAQQIQALGSPSFGFRWSELWAVAAVLLIGVSLLWPAMQRTRADARRVACANNLASVGASIGRYAADHRNTMPRRGGAKPGSVWWNVGQAPLPGGRVRSNSAHLFVLVRKEYATPRQLSCPDNSHAPHGISTSDHDWASAQAVSYSYQNQYHRYPMRLDQLSDIAILADKNPLFVKQPGHATGLMHRQDLDRNTSSAFHGRLGGQNILTVSGQVLWNDKPVGPNGDNIWVIRGIDTYRGIEVPQDLDDSFLVP